MSDYENAQSLGLQGAAMGQLSGAYYDVSAAEKMRAYEKQRELAEAQWKRENDRRAREAALHMALTHERNPDDAIKAARKFAAFLADG